MKYMRRTAGYIWTDYKTNAQIAKELKITPILDKLLECKRNWMQHVNRMPRNRLPRVMKRYSQLAEGIMADFWRGFWIRDTGTGQQVAQLHDRYMMMMMMMMMCLMHRTVPVDYVGECYLWFVSVQNIHWNVCYVQNKYVPFMLLPACRAAELHVNLFKDDIEMDIKEITLMTSELK